MADEGVHEIQLNGKQLVFLFMALTVFSVVVFLSGVMVGRGVRQPQTAIAADSTETVVDPTVVDDATPAPASAVNADRPPVSTQESLTYAERLEAPIPPPETLGEPVNRATRAAEPPQPDPVERQAAAKPAPVEGPVVPKPALGARTEGSSPASPALAEPPGNGFAVQVGAYPRGTADGIAKGLAAKGFPAFVTPRERGLFAVRVGKYTNRGEAEAVARRLEQNEQFNKPWVTR